MSERRMFTQKIVDSDAFLDMPLSAQALYFHLNMRADDDGFVNNPKKIQRMLGASEDDLKLLLAKRFILGFESGVIVIKHWRMHNLLRKDRYNPTQYQEEFSLLGLKENGSYTESFAHLATTCQPTDNQMATQDSIGKLSIDKSSIDAQNAQSIEEEFARFWSAYPNKKDKKRAHDAYLRISKKKEMPSIDVLLSAISNQKKSEQWRRDGGKYIPHPTTWLNGKRWEDEVNTGTVWGRPYIDISDPHSYDDEEDGRGDLFNGM